MARPNKYPVTAERLADICSRHGIKSDSELSRRVGVGRAAVSGWMKGQFRPEGANLTKLAEIFGVSEAYILGVEESQGVDTSRVSLALTAAVRARNELTEAISLLESQTTAGSAVVSDGQIGIESQDSQFEQLRSAVLSLLGDQSLSWPPGAFQKLATLVGGAKAELTDREFSEISASLESSGAAGSDRHKRGKAQSE